MHLFFNKLIYNNNIQRVRWLDEAYAYYFGEKHNLNFQEEINGAQQLEKHKNLDMNKLIKINFNDFYFMSYFIGKYIFENNLAKDYINLLKHDRQQIVEIGKTILFKSLNYFNKKTTPNL